LGTQWERPAIQVCLRGLPAGYQTAYNKIKEIAIALHGRQETVGGVVYKLIQQIGDIDHIKTDERQRAIFTARFQIQRS
jgi:hypothetical protein